MGAAELQARSASGEASFLNVKSSVTGRVWRARLSRDREAVAISQKYGLPDILGRVLAARDVDLEDVERFLAPTLRDLMPAAAAMCDLEAAAERISDAVMHQESIGIIGDYDVDGIGSCALLHRYLDRAGAAAHIHIPHRLDEGYGPNVETLESFRARGITLVVTVDCGVTAHDPLEHAHGLHMDVVVVDHHQASLELPRAHSIVNPNRQDDISGQGQLCAAGVTFVLLAQVHSRLKKRGHFDEAESGGPDLFKLLDLVALATVCDVVPLTGLNRALVSQGLKVMARRNNQGLAKLADAAGLRRRPDVHAAGFVLGPRINAAGRLGHAGEALELLTTADPSRAAEIARKLEAYNEERQRIELAVFERAAEQGERALGASADAPVLIVTGDGWHAGVLGLVAGRLKERFGRPALVVGFDENGIGQGSGRSIAGVDLGSAVRDAVAAGLLAKGGGHAMAAGVTLERGRLGAFRAFMEERLDDSARLAMADATLSLDGALNASAATVDLIELLERAGPFGMGNPTPRFAFPAHRVLFGDLAGREHVRCALAGQDGARLGAIAFRALGTPLGELLLSAQGAPLHVAGRLSVNDWGGKRSAQLMIDDVAVAS